MTLTPPENSEKVPEVLMDHSILLVGVVEWGIGLWDICLYLLEVDKKGAQGPGE